MRGGGITSIEFSDNSKNPNRERGIDIYIYIYFRIFHYNWARIAQPVEHCTYEVTL